jgi:hypothetical protein
LVVIVIIALLLSRFQWKTLGKLLRNVWNDWTLGVYGLYGLLPLFIPILLDETELSYRFPATAIAASIMLLGAVLYLRMPRSWLRTGLLIGGFYLTMLVAAVGSSLYWETYEVNLSTGVRKALKGPIPWERVLLPTLFGTTVPFLILWLIGNCREKGLYVVLWAGKARP